MTGPRATGPGLAAGVAELDLPPVSREIITDCLTVIDALALLTGRIDGELHQHAKADPRVKALRELPGVGEFIALVMVAEIGDITRFPSARKLAGSRDRRQTADSAAGSPHEAGSGPAGNRCMIARSRTPHIPADMADNPVATAASRCRLEAVTCMPPRV
jgi:Transposase IS116/IS110/IS902 family